MNTKESITKILTANENGGKRSKKNLSLIDGIVSKLPLKELLSLKNNLIDDISKIFAIAEDYPELKASENFINLSEEITKVEEEIANARKYYNGTVRNINVKIVTFPSMIVALIFGFKKEKMFEATTEERNDVEINL